MVYLIYITRQELRYRYYNYEMTFIKTVFILTSMYMTEERKKEQLNDQILNKIENSVQISKLFYHVSTSN